MWWSILPSPYDHRRNRCLVQSALPPPAPSQIQEARPRPRLRDDKELCQHPSRLFWWLLFLHHLRPSGQTDSLAFRRLYSARGARAGSASRLQRCYHRPRRPLGQHVPHVWPQQGTLQTVRPLQLHPAHHVPQPPVRPPSPRRTLQESLRHPWCQTCIYRQRHPLRPLQPRQPRVGLFPPCGAPPRQRPPQGGSRTHQSPSAEAHAQTVIRPFPPHQGTVRCYLPAGRPPLPTHPLFHQLPPRLPAPRHGRPRRRDETSGLPP